MSSGSPRVRACGAYSDGLLAVFVGSSACCDTQRSPHTTAVAPSADTTFWYHVNWANTTTDSFVLGWLLNVSSTQHLPRVFSISHGFGEAEVEHRLGRDYIPRSNLELMKLCTRGISVLAASGDGGSTDIGRNGLECALDPRTCHVAWHMCRVMSRPIPSCGLALCSCLLPCPPHALCCLHWWHRRVSSGKPLGHLCWRHLRHPDQPSCR